MKFAICEAMTIWHQWDLTFRYNMSKLENIMLFYSRKPGVMSILLILLLSKLQKSFINFVQPQFNFIVSHMNSMTQVKVCWTFTNCEIPLSNFILSKHRGDAYICCGLFIDPTGYSASRSNFISSEYFTSYVNPNPTGYSIPMPNPYPN